MFVEIPRGSRAKYELDKKTGHIRPDGVLDSSVHDPADYGFVMDTLGNDGDPLDAVVIVEEPTFPETFFATYTYLEADDTEVRGWHDEQTAWRVIEAARKRQARA